MVAPKPMFSFNLIRPAFSNNNKALASLEVSLGTAICAPSATASREAALPGYIPSGSKCTLATAFKFVPLFLL
jgi:hypothetical protein